MNEKDKIIFNNAVETWRTNKGVGTALIYPPFNDKYMISSVLNRIYNKNSKIQALIICNSFLERGELIEFLISQDNEIIDNSFKYKDLLNNKLIKIFTSSYLNNNTNYLEPFITILYHYDKMEDGVKHMFVRSRFRLAVLNKLNIEHTNKLYALSPLLNDFKKQELDSLRLSTPIEEIRIGIDIEDNSESSKLLKYYDEYIATSINIFGSFDNINYARIGDPKNSLSALQYCYQLALKNGWNDKLDMNIELNVQIDKLYNPTSIRERASQTYEIMRNRRNLLANYDGKLNEIAKLVQEHKDDKILIINKFGEFANKITEYLNNNSEKDICGNCHDKVDPIPAFTLDGEPIYVKSGKNKGERKFISAQAQKSYNEKRFNHGYINVISTANAPDKDLAIDVDVVIITSSECEEIESYLYRLSNLRFPKGKLKFYQLYITNTSEEKKLSNKSTTKYHNIVENRKNEKNNEFIIVD